MDIKIFLSSVDTALLEGNSHASAFSNNISIHTERMPDFAGSDIALIGLPDNFSDSFGPENPFTAASEIRRKLYRLRKGHGAYKVIDLGNLRSGSNLEDTYLRIQEVCDSLISQNILPVFIGGTHDMDYGQYRGYEEMEKLVSVLNVDAMLDMEEQGNPNQKHLNSILLHEPNFLFNYSHLAYQSYLIDPKIVSVLEKLYFEAYRIGHLRSNIQEMEPVIRNADMLTFDISAIKSSDSPGTSNAQPFGLTGEEACQICWYAGLNEKLSSVGIYEYNPVLDDSNKKTASVAATMIWYFIEGFYHRKNDKDFRTNDYLKYVVAMPSHPGTLVFYKSKLSDKWWLEVPYPEGKSRFDRNCIVPCSYSDYELAQQGDLPDRYISAHTKLI